MLRYIPVAPDAHLTSIGQTAVAVSAEAPADDSGAAPASGPRRTRPRWPALDGLRALAIAAVVWHHSLPSARPGLLGRGYLGVPLFFALSGFLITRLLLAERQATGDIALGRFWLRRGLRIVPLYYVVLAGFVVRVALLEPDDATRHFFASLPAYASYTSNWFVRFDVPHPVWFGFAWSLATEEQFYLWWPPLLRLAARAGRWLAPLLLLVVLGFDQLAEHGAFAAWLPSGTVSARVAESSSGAMAIGALLALLLEHPLGHALLATRHAASLAAFAALALIWTAVGPPIALDLAFAVLVAAAALARGRGALLRALTLPWLLHIGRISYAIYLFHVPWIGLLSRGFPGLREQPAALFAGAFALSAVTASVSYRYFEGPLLELRERFHPALSISGAPGLLGARPP
jgi:peptidoglycan/LPS O-acetylase OafA/YrhL